MIKQSPSEKKNKASIFGRAIDFIRNLFSPLINWFHSLFNPAKKKEEAPVELKPAISNTVQVQQPAVETPVIKQEIPAEAGAVEVNAAKEREVEARAAEARAAEKPTKEALLAAVRRGDVVPLEKLLEKADPDIIKEDPSILLYIAIETGNLDVVKLLVKYGLDLKSDCTVYGTRYDVLELAIQHQHPELVKLLLDNKLCFDESYFRRLEDEGTLILGTEKKKEIFKILLDRITFTFSSFGGMGGPCLEEAIKIGHIEGIKRALENKNRVTPSTQISETQDAIKCNQLEIAKLFLTYARKNYDKSTNASEKSKYIEGEQTVFSYAVRSNELEAVKLLLSFNPVRIDLNANMFQSPIPTYTALYDAIKYRQHEMVLLLLNAGANLALPGQYSKTEIEEIEKYQKELMAFVQEKNPSLEKELGLPKPILNIVFEYAYGLPKLESDKPEPTSNRPKV